MSTNRFSRFRDPPEQKHAKEIRELKEELRLALKDSCKKTEEIDKLQSQLRKYQVLFTPGILKRIETGKLCDLVEEDKSFCIALESMGPIYEAFWVSISPSCNFEKICCAFRFAAGLCRASPSRFIVQLGINF